MTATPDDELTELVDADFPRVDLVGKGANGIPRFVISKEAADSGGLLDPEYVRDLISKAEPGTGSEETITMSGSPAAIAKLMHEAAERSRINGNPGEAAFIAKAQATYPADPLDVAVSKATFDTVVKAKYNAADKKRMAASGAAMADGSYPIEDEDDLDKAIHAVGRGGASHNAIRKHIITRAKSLGKSSMIPDNWGADGSLKAKVSKDALDVIDPDLDAGSDGMDPTTPFTGPGDDDAPGDPTDPGSPAWEAIDAATAQKWLAIASRLQNALGLLADREMLEAATGADPDDAENAWNLQDAQCAVEFAIEQLAVFAAGEQAEAEIGIEMDAIGKALAGFDPEPLAVVEGLTAVRKAGRVLSAANEQLIKDAAGALQRVLSSLPAPVEKEASQPAGSTSEEGSMPKPETSAEAVAASGQEPVMGTAKADGQTTKVRKARKPRKPRKPRKHRVVKGVSGLPIVVFDERGAALGHVRTADILSKVAKADGDDGDKPSLCAVFDQNGDLIGVVDPSQIQPVSGAGKPAADDTDAEGGGSEPEPSTAPAGDDLAPQPAAATGTPADGVAKAGQTGDDSDAEGVAKSDPDPSPNEEITALKGAVDQVTESLARQSAEHAEVVAKMAGDNAALGEEVRVLKERLETVEQTPAALKVMARGQVPPPAQLRGQDRGAAAATVDVAKARELKETLYRGTAQEQNAAFGEMQEAAIAGLAALRARGPNAAG